MENVILKRVAANSCVHWCSDPLVTLSARSAAKLPDLSLHIVDENGKERDQFALGEMLKVQIRMSDESKLRIAYYLCLLPSITTLLIDTYGIFIRNLIAKDGQDRRDNLTLIDNRGCPGETRMMREVRTIDDSKSLESFLEVFTFTGSSKLELEAEVETCLEKCKPVSCALMTGRSDDNVELVQSYGRRRRRRRRSAGSQDAQLHHGHILRRSHLAKAVNIITPNGPSTSSEWIRKHIIPRRWSSESGQPAETGKFLPPVAYTLARNKTNAWDLQSRRVERSSKLTRKEKAKDDICVPTFWSSHEMCMRSWTLGLIGAVSFIAQIILLMAAFVYTHAKRLQRDESETHGALACCSSTVASHYSMVDEKRRQKDNSLLYWSTYKESSCKPIVIVGSYTSNDET